MTVKASTSLDLQKFYEETIAHFKATKRIAETRNKTTKIKAIISTIAILEARLDAGLKYTKAGGKTEFDVIFQQQMYNPIVEWLIDEVSK